MIKQNECCPYCDSQLINSNISNCPQCGAPLGKTEIEFIEVHKSILRLIRTTANDFGGVAYICQYRDGSYKRLEISQYELITSCQRGEFISQIFARYIQERVVREFDLDEKILSRLTINNNYGLAIAEAY